MKYTVYMHKSKINKKSYIGITSQNPKKRWQRGLGYKNSNSFFEEIKKYGWDNFEHIILYSNLTKEEAEKKEIEMIKKYKTNNKKYGFNVYSGGFHAPMCEEQKIKISNTEKGKKISRETIEKIKKTKKENYLRNGLTKKQKEHYNNMIKPIICLETGIIYYGQKDLIKNGFNSSCVQLVCSGKRKTSKGLHWEFLKKEV